MSKKFKCHKCGCINEFEPGNTSYLINLREALRTRSKSREDSRRVYIIECEKCGIENRVTLHIGGNHEKR